MSIKRKSRLRRVLIWLGLTTAVLACGAAVLALESFGIAPRLLAPYLERRASGHNPAIERIGEWSSATLRRLDRGDPESRGRLIFDSLPPGSLPVPAAGPAKEVLLASAEEARRAIALAEPGTVLAFLPGTYRFDASLSVTRPGRADAPITVRAMQPGTVILEFDMLEGFHVMAPYWNFENLTIKGVCIKHSSCEHAFHVVGPATNFSARHNRITDFNAHIKVNGDAGRFPDKGLFEGNILDNSAIRQTGNPVTPIDLVAASHWTIRGNLIMDFAKGGADKTSYGAFAKGAGSGNRFERNIILCEKNLRSTADRRVGLSLGGGGTSTDACRDGRCIVEQEGGVIDSNLIAYCSDEGIYINRAASTRILRNTLIDTAGIVLRSPETSADVEGNLVDGGIRADRGALERSAGNLVSSVALAYIGRHPVRGLFVDPAALDLRWSATPPRSTKRLDPLPDLCGRPRPEQPTFGAFEDFAACLPKDRRRPSDPAR